MNPGVYPGFTAGIVQVGKPVRTTIYTSGTGTYRPTSTNAWCQITLVGGGGAGGSGRYGGGWQGGAAAVFSAFVKLPGPVSYSVGAGGTQVNSAAGNNGGNTTLGSYTATGGAGGRLYRENLVADRYLEGPPGESSPFGSGGQGGTPYANGAAGGGYGSGGGSAGLDRSSGITNSWAEGGNGAGGLIIIEDFGP